MCISPAVVLPKSSPSARVPPQASFALSIVPYFFAAQAPNFCMSRRRSSPFTASIVQNSRLSSFWIWKIAIAGSWLSGGP